MRQRPVFWPLIRLQFIWLFSLPAFGLAQDDLDDRFDSENKSTTVRPSILDEKSGSFKKAPYKISRKEIKKLQSAPIKSDDIAELNRKTMHNASVIGKVESVYLTPDGKKLILNIGRDHRFCFKAVIDEENFPKFGKNSAKGIASLYLRKVVLVNGLIYQLQDLPQIEVTLPYQLEVVAGK